MTSKAGIVRSTLVVPAANRHMIEKAATMPADVVCLDLEDSVVEAKKAESRGNVVWALTEIDWGRRSVGYRVNGLDTPWFYRDLIDVVERAGGRLSLVVIPKVSEASDIKTVDTLLGQIEQAMGLERGGIRIHAIIEGASGVLNAGQIAASSSRLAALIFGPGDFASSMKMPSSAIGAIDEWDEAYGGQRNHYPMMQIAVAGRSAGVQLIDGPMANFRDADAFRQSCLRARALGYNGKWCIHPSQITMANEIFSPTSEEIAWAQRVVDAYRQASGTGVGAASIDGTMIDVASIRMAETTLELAVDLGLA